MFSLIKLRPYRRMWRLLRWPVRAGGRSSLPGGYYLFVDGTIKVLRDWGWYSEVVGVFNIRTSLEVIKESLTN